MITVTILGKEHSYPEGISFLALAKEWQKEYEDDIILATFDGKLMELFNRVPGDGEISFLTTADKNGRRAYRRSLVFVMQRALLSLYPDQSVDIVVDHSLGAGYFCRVVGIDSIDEAWLLKLKEAMDAIIERDIPIAKRTIKTSEAMKIFEKRGMKDKKLLMHFRSSSTCNVYDLDGCIDYFYGYMAPSTGMLSYYELYLYKTGFILQFPDKDSRQAAPFDPAGNLFLVLQNSGAWGKSLGISSVASLNEAVCHGKTQDIILSQEAFMERRIGELAETIAADPDKKFIMIAGPSSSGKTTFSHRLSAQLRALGLTPHPVPLDDYYLDRDQIPLDEFGQKDFECIEGLDIAQFNEDMSRLLAGERVLLPSFNFKTGKREYRDHYMQLGKRDVLVIEGIHGLNERMSASLPKENKFKIYISALTQLNIDEHNPLSTTDGRLIRRIVRDARTRGTSAKETIAMWDSVRRGEEKNIFPFQEEADVMFNSALIYEMSVLKIYAVPNLLSIEPGCPEYAEAKRLLKLLDYFIAIPADDICNNSLLREFIGGSCLDV